ncbi:MAG: alpha/beta hydrolase [Opitutaceae bacterium]|nr:alpha/beta hydrolase [Opitutaceae bacterium]
MAKLELFYATNRRHEGGTRFRPKSYGTAFSEDGIQNLRFGRLELQADDARITELLRKDRAPTGPGAGVALSTYLAKCTDAGAARILAYREKLPGGSDDAAEDDVVLGSLAMFADLMKIMCDKSDVLIYIHGFNVSWAEAVGGALALQLMLNRGGGTDAAQQVAVVLFTWPSDGQAMPWLSYKSDRAEGTASSGAFARGLLKLRDYLADLRDRAKDSDVKLCGQDIHLLCHSMGNFLLQKTLPKLDDFTPGDAFPRFFEHIFLCAPDLDDDALEPDQGLGRVHELARSVTLYHNRDDIAMHISDYTKGNPDRLGGNGAARPSLLHNKVHQVDCTEVVTGLVEHSYYLEGWVNQDIRLSIEGREQLDLARRRALKGDQANVWKLPAR